MTNTYSKSLQPQLTENFNFESGISKDAIFTQLYRFLYGFCDKNQIIALINDYNVKGYSGFCTNKWLEETVAIKCYDCEYDGTCAICLYCFFDSDHKGHEYRLTKTSGGCCDCGDVSSWDVKGSCSAHTNGSIFDEKCTLDLFTNHFLIRFEKLIRDIINNVSCYLHNINAVNGETLQILVLFLNDLANVTPAYRYSLSLCLSRAVLKDWMLRHQILPNDLQKSFNSFYLTMITSMSFKKKFSSLFAELYVDIVQPLKEIQDDWHLSNLSVQLFTYSNIAFELVKNQFMDTCIDPIVDKAQIDKRLNTLQFARFDRKKFNLYIRIISDLTYLMNHTVVCHLLLSDERLQKTVFGLFFVHNNMNLIERYSKTHVQFENTGYSISFTVEHSLHSAFKPLSDYIKSIKESDITLVLNFYKNFNDFIKNNAVNVTYNTHKLTRSFHIPLVRLFSSVVDFNLVRRYVKYHLTNLAMTDEKMASYLNKSFLHLKSNETFPFDLLEIFDNNVLKYVLKSTINVLKFAMEINHNLWVYNGESLRDQRTTYYELLFDSFDIASIQMAVVLLGMKNFKSDFDVLSYIFEICFDLENYQTSPFKTDVESYSKSDIVKDEVQETSIQEINNVVEQLMCDVEGGNPVNYQQQRIQRSDANGEEDTGSLIDYNFISEGEAFDIKFHEFVSGKSDPGSFDFKINFFYILLNTLVNDIKHLEILSISRKTTKEWFVNRGYPLLLMDIVNTLASGNVEFGHIVNETKKHWKHHPMFIQTIEQVAIFNYSKVSDKTYIRLKPEAYNYIDILWNTHHPATHVISNECINHDISLLGPAEADAMSPEYRETQAIILNSISCNMLFNYVSLVFLYFSKMHFNLDNTYFESLPDLYKTQSQSSLESNYKRFEVALNMVLSSNNKIKSCSHLVLYSLKILNLLYSKLPPPEEATGVILVSCLMLMIKSIDDDVYKKCSNYTLSMLNRVYNFKNNLENLNLDSQKKDVKMIQKKYINRIFQQQSLFKIESDNMEHIEEQDNEESIVCILCKQKMDSQTAMSCMCFISTNNVLRRCSSSNGIYFDYVSTDQFSGNNDISSNMGESLPTSSIICGSNRSSIITVGKSFNDIYGDIRRRTNYGVYTKSSMPLKSSVISSCGHVAHTKCINEHRNAQGDIPSFSIYGINRASTEFLCPMCKTLCNFTLNMVPDSKMKKYRENLQEEESFSHNVNGEDKIVNSDDASVEVASAMSLDETNEKSELSDTQSNDSSVDCDNRQIVNRSRIYKTKTFIKDEDNSKNKIYDLCAYSWRYPYSNFWIPCPVYAKNERQAQYVYALSMLSTSKNINHYLNTDAKTRVDELCLSSNATLKNLDCTYCSNFDFELLNINLYKCEAFKHKESYQIPLIRVFDRCNAVKMDAVYRFFMQNWEIIMTTNVYNLIDMNVTQINYTEMFPRALLTPYSRALFSDKRAYFGIRNWRHINSTVEIDPKFWLLYNELLSTSSVRRNMLNVPNAFYSQLIRNFYFTGIKSDDNHYDFKFLNLREHKVTLDKTYHDCGDTRMVLPELSLYKDKMLNKETNMVRSIVESLSESNLTILYDKFCNDSKNIDGSYYEESNAHEDFMDRLKNANYDPTTIKSIMPLTKYLFNTDKQSPYKMFGNDMLLNPWSFDYIREFLQVFLSDRNYSRAELTEYVYFFMVVSSLQVMDRFIVDVMRLNYRRFIDKYSDGDEKLLKTRLKIEFMTSYIDKFSRDLLLNAEFPCDVVSRIAFTDFKENTKEFKSYNMMVSRISETRKQFNNHLSPNDFQSHDQLTIMLSEMIEYTGMLRSVHDTHVEALTEPIPYDQIVHDRVNTYITDDLLERHMFNQISRIVNAREIHNNLNNNYDFEEIAYSLEHVLHKDVSPKRQRLHNGKNESSQDSPSSILKNASNSTTRPRSKSNLNDMYKGVDLSKRLNMLLYKNHSNTVFFETLKHNIPDSIHILDFIDSDFAKEISKVDLDSSPCFLSVIEKVFNFTIRYFIQMGYINYEPFQRDIYSYLGRNGNDSEDFGNISAFKPNENDEVTCAIVEVMFEKYKAELFESLNLFLDVAFWSINSIFKYEDEVSSKVLYGHLNSNETRFNLLIEALGIGATSNKMKPSEIVATMFSEAYERQMELNRNCNMEVTPPIMSKYSLIDIERHLTELHWDMIKNTALRSCANCGLKPANPLLCLLCGSLVCSNNDCCHKVQTSQDTRFMAQVEKKLKQLKKREFISIYEEEMVAHAKVCGGGQCIYFSPYHCCVVLVEERRRTTIPSIYLDQYGNSDLHSKVYGEVKLARVRLDNIVNTFCSGRLSNEIVAQRKQLINLLV
ncbi:hypothetical protein MACK_002851 [Theileria orientalis]|uniref:E3 ubiquitin-protein ligase n=1 Tax=Theileria orientalis TaxID=68886 RepID=A0A976ME67_THEOR|nr:hypothetical protein MACK_002851 [Theileria orientalis]